MESSPQTGRRPAFFDYASTTQCCEQALELLRRYSGTDFGNPSSAHSMGQIGARAIQEARSVLAGLFKVTPEHVIFTGGGTESDNLAIYGVALPALERPRNSPGSKKPRVLASAIEHAAVRKTVLSLGMLGFDPQLIPVDRSGQVVRSSFEELLTPETVLVSIHQVNNVLGTLLPVDELARLAKRRVPGVIFHTDAVQAFGKTQTPVAGSAVDLVSISAHKIEGPKGVGALIVLDRELLRNQKLRPLIWGGEQEAGFRSGTQNAGLIAGFGAAAAYMAGNLVEHSSQAKRLRDHFHARLKASGLLGSFLIWNSPENALPYIVSLSVPSLPAPMLARLLDEQGYVVSTGSACSSGRSGPDAVLTALGLPHAQRSSSLRISFSHHQTSTEVDGLVDAMSRAIEQLKKAMTG